MPLLRLISSAGLPQNKATTIAKTDLLSTITKTSVCYVIETLEVLARTMLQKINLIGQGTPQHSTQHKLETYAKKVKRPLTNINLDSSVKDIEITPGVSLSYDALNEATCSSDPIRQSYHWTSCPPWLNNELEFLKNDDSKLFKKSHTRRVTRLSLVFHYKAEIQ